MVSTTVAASVPRPARHLVVTGMRAPAHDVIEFTLADPGGATLPAWTPGAHIDLFPASGVVRQYSLCGSAEDRHSYTVAVRITPDGSGGSRAMAALRDGDTLPASDPRNHFELIDSPAYLFIAGGIGITPILPMIRAVNRRGAPWALTYGGRSEVLMPYLDELRSASPSAVDVWTDEVRGPIDVAGLLNRPQPDTAVYCCGPEPLLAAVEKACTSWPAGSLHLERFAPRPVEPSVSHAFDVVLARSGFTVRVDSDRSVLDAIADCGITMPFSCTEGTCGTCETSVLGGSVEHRDSILTSSEREENRSMMICVSRAHGDRLILDC